LHCAKRDKPPGAQGIEAGIPQALPQVPCGKAEKLKRKARFFAAKPQKMRYKSKEAVPKTEVWNSRRKQKNL
jgi:hypothetical protein